MIVKKLRRPCKKCRTMYIPCGRFSRVCPECCQKEIDRWRRERRERMEQDALEVRQ